MINPLAIIIGELDTRLKKLEDNIGSATDVVLNFMSVMEGVGTTDYVYVYKREINTSFLLGHGELGEDLIGDRRGAPVLLYEGGGL